MCTPTALPRVQSNQMHIVRVEEEEEALEQKKQQKIEENNRKIAENNQKAAPPRRVTVKAPAPTSAPEDPEQNETDQVEHPYPHSDQQYSLTIVPLCVDTSSEFDGKSAVRIMAQELVTFFFTYKQKDIRIQLLVTTEQNQKYPFAEELVAGMNKYLQKNHPIHNILGISTWTDNFSGVIEQ